MDNRKEIVDKIRQSVEGQVFVKLTLSKPPKKTADLKNVYMREVTIKGESKYSFTYRYKTNDQVKNFTLEEAITEIESLLQSSFRVMTLFSLKEDVTLQINKKGNSVIRSQSPTFTNKLPDVHDREKKKRSGAPEYLKLLGVMDANGIVIPKMADKYRQINKYLEIMEGLLKDKSLPKQVNIVDMGSGKGYLTFALYDYLKNNLKLDVKVTGVELRKALVQECNEIALQCGFKDLQFEDKPIEDFGSETIDVLIALHACDTATDDAIAQGLKAEAALIVCAPCCHKQIRQQLKGKPQENPMLKYGIFKEREYEMVTDTIRALILEKNSYDSKIFEFISNEHTRKNVMLVGSKSDKKGNAAMIDDKIKGLKESYGIDHHYLENLV